MTFGQQTCLAVFFFATVYACGKNDTSRTSGAGASNLPTPCPSSGCVASSPKPQSEATLAAYLLPYTEASAVTTLVESYVTPPYTSSEIESSSSFSAMRSFVSTFFKKVMAIATLTPGRSFNVHIIQDTSLNAFADGFQNIGINSGVLSKAIAMQILPVLCHEIAHSAWNHSVKHYLWMQQNADVIAAYDAAEAYINDAYNDTTKKYKHNLAAYRTVVAQWNAVTAKMALQKKKGESQADVVGAMICANFGVTAESFRNGMITFLALADSLESSGSSGKVILASGLKDGETVTVGDLDALFDFLFDLDSHPNLEERNSQLARLAVPIAKFYTANTLSSDFATGYKTSGGVSLMLPEEPELSAVTVTDLGQTIVLKKRRGCY